MNDKNQKDHWKLWCMNDHWRVEKPSRTIELFRPHHWNQRS